ncbi:MAG: hypothetical protein D6729_03520 [Deltaproteobacteria bacterium]|nr:MAG: hypothetical protein D6729_03520 [Deltaproteobacteria bacterium]
MHRLAGSRGRTAERKRTARRARHLWRILPAVLVVAGACSHAVKEVRDPPYVEQLRVRITKVRHAIDETRRTIAKSQGAPYLPELYTRLAELLSEEAKYHYQVAYEREQRSTKSLHVPQVRLLKEQAIGTYRLVLKRFPDTPLAPRILFNIGHEHRELGNFEEMEKTLLELVEKYPDSPLRDEALLVLGDYYFDKQKLDQSEAYYRKILSGKPGRVTGLAFYKLAWVRVNKGDCKQALDAFEKAILASRAYLQAAEKHSDVAEAGQSASGQDIDVRREALVDLTYCYTRERKPEDAVRYVRSLSSSRAAYIAALEKLASRYGIMNQPLGAILVARELLRLAPDSPDRLDDARMLYAALKRSKNYSRVGDDVALIVEAGLRQAHNPQTNPESRAQILEEFEKYGRDLATRAQARAMKRRSRGLARQVAKAYVAYLAGFPDTEARADVLLNLADVLARAGDDFNAGRRYLEAAPLVKDEKERQNAYYDAVVHLQRALDAKLDTQVERVVARAGLRRAGTKMLEFEAKPDRVRKVKFSIARTYYEEGRYREAIDRLTAIAYEYPGTDESNAAVHLVLDSYRTINDYEGLMAAGHRFLAADSPISGKVKSEIKPIVVAAEQLRLDELSLKAAGEEGGGISELEAFAVRYEGTELGERALLNAFVAARAAGESEKLYEIGNKLLEKYPKSEQLAGILATLARTATARFEFDRAIEFFRKAAEVNPGERVALLTAAGALKEELADVEGAKALYREALRGAEGAARAQAAAALASLLERTADPDTVLAELRPLASDGNPEVLARIGLAYVRKGRFDEAETAFSSVLDAASGASVEAQARAHYGMAEVLNHALEEYQPPPDLTAIQEFVALIEVAEQSYLNAARQGSPLFTAAALVRLAQMSKKAAARLAKVELPSDLSAAEKKQVRDAFAARVKQLEQQATDALGACAGQAWSRGVFNPVVRACLSGRLPEGDPVRFDRLRPRRAATSDAGLKELRARLSKNPEDADSLRALGIWFLENGDPHAARLVFARVQEVGGAAADVNLLGIASYEAGDVTGALEAFAQAAEGGVEAARQNLAYVLAQEGLGEAAKLALQKLPEGTESGRLLPGAGGRAAPPPRKGPAQATPAKTARKGDAA